MSVVRASTFVVLAFALAAGGCGGDDAERGGGPTDGAPGAPDRTTWEATFKDDATVVEGDAIAKLKNRDATDGVYRFEASVGDVIAKLPVGRAVVLTGVDVVRVKSVVTEGDEIVLATEPAALPDVVQEGKATWDVAVDVAAPPPAPAAKPAGLQILAAPASAPVSKLSYSGPVGMFDVKGDYALTPDSLGFKGLVSFKDGNAIFKAAIEGTVKRFRHSGEVVIHNGKLEGFYFEVKELDVVLDMDLGGVALGKGNEAFTIPVEIVVPQAIGPIPTFFSVGAKLEVNPSLGATSSSRGNAHFVVKGSAGVQWTPAAGFMKLGSLEGSDVQFTNYEGVSTLDCGLGVLAQFPVVKFGVGINPAGATVYLTHKTEVVTNMTMRYEAAGPFPVITGNCFEANLNLGTYVGGQARLAGLSVGKEIPVWTKVRPLVKDGDACK